MTSPSRGAARVDLYYARPADLDDTAAWKACHATLTAEERARCEALTSRVQRRETIATRALVRVVLSLHAPLPAHAWRFVSGPHGKPAVDPACLAWAGLGVAAPHRAIHFNVSNSVDLVACAVSADGDVGVDLEPLHHGAHALEVAETVFTPAERAALAAAAGGDRSRHARCALELWTMKEAYMKARGLGVALPPESFAIDGLADDGVDDPPRAEGFAPTHPLLRAPRLAADPWPGDDPSAWRFERLEVDEHVVCVCVRAPSHLPLPVASRRVPLA